MYHPGFLYQLTPKARGNDKQTPFSVIPAQAGNPSLLTYHLWPIYQLTPYPDDVDTNQHKGTLWTDVFGLHTL